MNFRAGLIFFILVIITGCGGGSAGTGLGNSSSVEGRILQQGLPIAGAIVTIVETGDSGITNEGGSFSIPVDESLESYTLDVLYNDTVSRVPITSNSNGSIINLEIDVGNNPAEPIDVKLLEVQGKIVGICDQYFENKRIIRQSNKAPQGIECTAKVKVAADSKPLGGARFAVQHRKCSQTADWRTDAVSETSQKFSPGIGQLQFKFFDDPDHCYYRIIVPFETKGVNPVEVLLETFTAQAN